MVATHCITTGSKFHQAAWDYIRFITATPEGQALIGEGAYETPARPDPY
jgi:hypothetical protein